MSQVDADWKTIRDAFDPWIHQTLSFGKEDVPTGGQSTAGDRTNRYRFANDARHPTLVSATEFALRFASAMDRTAPDFKTVATGHLSLYISAKVGVVRRGTPPAH